MLKEEYEQYSKRFIVLGFILIAIGLLHFIRASDINAWVIISSGGLIFLGLMQFALAYRLKNRAEK